MIFFSNQPRVCLFVGGKTSPQHKNEGGAHICWGALTGVE